MKKGITAVLISAMISTNIGYRGNISYANDNTDIKANAVSYEGENLYETFKRPVPKTISQENLSKHEQKDLQGLSQINYFKLKTDSNYEIALSHGDGNYTYLESTDTLDEAINIANDNKQIQKSQAIPVVINEDGLIVYATDAIAKVVKMKDGQPISQNTTIDLYKDSEGKNKHTYISPMVIDDVPVVEVKGNMVKIEVAGFNGWIPMSDSKGENLIILPINDAPNLSYYQVNANNGLVHVLSTAVETEGEKETIPPIGPKPSFMQKQKNYYSYDGMYFYENINTLISDLKAGHHNNSVNANNPYYNYYTSVPGRTKTVYSADELNKYINDNAKAGSALIGTGESFIKYQDTYGVNALMALGVSINESAFGTQLVKPNNIFGIGAYDGNEEGYAASFDSVDECIQTFMNKKMSTYYYSQNWSKYNGSSLGNKNIGVNVNYASDPYWSEKAASHMYRIDNALSNGELKEYNNNQIGIYTKADQVLSADNQLVHKVLNERSKSAQVGDFVLIDGQVDGKYKISPDRAKLARTGTHDWNFKGYINKNSVKLINEVNNTEEVKVNQLIGGDRYQTAIKVSKEGWSTSENVVIVNSSAIVDALSATPFAYSKNAPILLTQKEGLNGDTKAELQRLKAKKIYIIGGTGVVSEKVISDLKAMNLTVERISGDDRYKTSLAVAKKLSNVSEITVVNGVTGLPDAVSISPVAANKNMPIVLASPTDGVSTFNDYIKNNNIKKSYVIGSTSAVSEAIASKLPNPTRLGGLDRNQTNAMIIERFYTDNKLNNIFVAKDGMKDSGQLIDALAVGVLAAKEQSPVVIVGNKLEAKQKNILSSKLPSELTQVGAGGNENAFNELKNIYK